MFKKMGMTLVIVGAITLSGCGAASSSTPTSSSAVDPAAAKLQSAFDTLGGLIADPTNITTGFQVPINLANGVTATWTSAQPGVLGFTTTPVNGLINATVNRPLKGNGDATFSIFADLSIAAELTAGNLTRRWTQGVTVKQSTVDLVVINSIADILALNDPALDRTLNVTVANLTIFARSGGEAFAYDGTGIIQIFGGAAENLTVGKVYTISGLIDWYYGIWEIVNSTAVEQVNATPQNPPKETISGVSGEINSLTTDGAHLSAGLTAAAGNFEPIYATVTGKVAVIADRPANYNTYIIDKAIEPAAFVAGTDSVPANALLVYYKTVNYDLIKAYVGLEITIDVVIYAFRNDQKAFAVYYVGGPTGIQANLTPEQKQTIDLAALSVPSSIIVATNLSLPTTGLNGTTVTWSSSDQTVITTSGVVTIPNPAKVVTLTASVTIESLVAKTRTFEVAVGALEVSTMQQLLNLSANTVAYSEGEVMWKNANSTNLVLADATGYGLIFVGFNTIPAFADLKVGDFIGVNYKVGLRNSRLPQMTEPKILVPTGTKPTIPTPTATTMNATEINTYFAQARVSPNFVTINDLVGHTNGNNTNAYLAGIGNGFIQTFGASKDLRGKKFNVTGWIFDIGAGSPAISMSIQGITYSDATLAPSATLAERLAIASDRYAAIAPKPNAELKQNVVLPVINSAVEIGATIAWTSDNPSVISNTGVVTRPAAGSPNVNVKLSYVLTVGGTLTSTAVEINFTVLAVVPGELLTVLATAPTGSTIDTVVGTNYASNVSLNPLLFNLNFVKNKPVVAAFNTAGQIRLYGDRTTGDGNQLNLAIPAGYRITQIKISFITGSTPATSADITLGSTVITLGASDLTTQTKTYSDLDVTSFSIKNTHFGGTANGQVWISAFEITYQEVIA